jgi:hypothetical protein
MKISVSTPYFNCKIPGKAMNWIFDEEEPKSHPFSCFKVSSCSISLQIVMEEHIFGIHISHILM